VRVPAPALLTPTSRSRHWSPDIFRHHQAALRPPRRSVHSLPVAFDPPESVVYPAIVDRDGQAGVSLPSAWSALIATRRSENDPAVVRAILESLAFRVPLRALEYQTVLSLRQGPS
jgi:hypothetical protein